jgi:chemotaxis protein MotB
LFKNRISEEMSGSENEFSVVFSDIMSFIAGLFILLFTIANSQNSISDYLSEMGLRVGGKNVEQTQKTTSEDLFVSEIKNFIQDERLSQYAIVLVDEQLIRIIFNDPILFKSGTDVLLPESTAVLNGFIAIVKRVDNPLWIEGHTDNFPVNPGGLFRSNWDLAYYRASAVANYMMSKGIPPSRLAVISYGDQRPMTSNATVNGRKKNRRIEIGIVRVKRTD